MSQSTLIAGAIFVAWVVYITVKGELPSYLGIFGFGAGAPASGGTVVPGAAIGNPLHSSSPLDTGVVGGSSVGQFSFGPGSAISGPETGTFQDTGGTMI